MDEDVQENIEVPIGEIQAKYLSKSITVKGQIVDMGNIQPKIQKAIFRCERCEHEIEVCTSDNGDLLIPNECSNETCGRKNCLERVNETYIDYRSIKIAKILDKNKVANNNSLLVEMEGDLVTIPSLDAKVSITGIVKTSLQGKRNSKASIGDYILQATSIEQLAQSDLEPSPDNSTILKDKDNTDEIMHIAKEIKKITGNRNVVIEDIYKKAELNGIDRNETDAAIKILRRSGDLVLTMDKKHIAVI